LVMKVKLKAVLELIQILLLSPGCMNFSCRKLTCICIAITWQIELRTVKRDSAYYALFSNVLNSFHDGCTKLNYMLTCKLPTWKMHCA
jgi:hypothetical protein